MVLAAHSRGAFELFAARPFRWLAVLFLAAMSLVAPAASVSAQISCSGVTPSVTANGYIDGLCFNNFGNCASDGTVLSPGFYDNPSWSSGYPTGVFLVYVGLPDADRPSQRGNVVKIFGQDNSPPLLDSVSASCPGGTVSGSGSSIATVALSNGASCSLTVTVNPFPALVRRPIRSDGRPPEA